MTVPSALSIHNFVNSVGAYVGLGSILAVALLVLLYFAHARETATLRDRLEEAQHRIGGLEGRVAQLIQAQAAAARRVPGPAPVTPAPASVRPAVAPAPAGRTVPSPAAAATVATVAPAAGTGGITVTGAPAGTAAPALASATKLIPDPAGAGSGAPDDTIFVPRSRSHQWPGRRHACADGRRGHAGHACGRCISTHPQREPAGCGGRTSTHAAWNRLG